MSTARVHLFKEFSLDLARGCLVRAGEPVHLRPQSYEVLKYLVENKGHLISKDKLNEEVWHGRAVTDGSLGKCIEEVREALGVDARHWVRTVRGRGYILDPGTDYVGRASSVRSTELDVLAVVVDQEELDLLPQAGGDSYPARRRFDDLAPLNSLDTATEVDFTGTAQAVRSTLGVESARSKSKPRPMLLAFVVLLVVAAAFIYVKYPANRTEAVSSIAVVPFVNVSGDPNLEYISDGLSESLIDRLSQLPGVKVIARSSSFKYKDKEVDPQAAGKALGVDALVTGRVMQRGDRLEVRAELVNTRDGTQLWGKQYSRRATEVQSVQEDITRAVAENLRLQLSSLQEQQLARRATENSQAYQFYLNGLFHLRNNSSEDVRKALAYFNKAVALDSNFALAWVGVANANISLAGNSLLATKEANANARAAAQRAVELDKALPEAHVALAIIKQHEWDWVVAEREFNRAIELSPNLEEAHSWYSRYLSLMERHEEAMSEIKIAQELDPLRVDLRFTEARVLMLAGRNDEAIQLLQSNRPGPDSMRIDIGLLYAAKGMHAQALNEYRRASTADLEKPFAQIALGHALAISGKTVEARAILARLKITKEYVSQAELAILYVGLGDKEGALASLERAYASQDLQLQYLKVEPHYESLRSDPRFQALVRRVGLPHTT